MAMSSADSMVSDTAKLSGASNYSVWKFRIKNVLIKEDLWDLVESITVPAGTDAAEDGVVVQSAPSTIAATILERKKKRALAIICLSVKDEVIPHVSNFTEPATCWARLKELYDNNSTARKILLKNKLMNMRMQEDMPVADFLQNIQLIINQLASIGEVIADSDLIALVLSSLPDSWDAVASTIIYRSVAPTFSELSGLMMQEELRRETKGMQKAQLDGFFAHIANTTPLPKRQFGNVRRPYGGVGKPRPFVARQHDSRKESMKKNDCNFCGSPTHWMRNCPELATELKKRVATRTKPSINLNMAEQTGQQPTVLDDDDVDNFFNAATDLPTELAAEILDLNLLSLDTTPKTTPASATWYLDSGASASVTGDKGALANIKSADTSVVVKTAGGQTHPVAGKGTIVMDFSEPINAPVLYVPGVRKNLLSVGSLADRGLHFFFCKQDVVVLNTKHKVIGHGLRDPSNGLYKFSFPTNTQFINEVSLSQSQNRLWHQRLGHINQKSLVFMAKHHIVNGLPATLSPTSEPCTACLLGKQSCERTPRQSRHRSSRPLDLIHSDLCGPLQTPSLSGAKYILTFTDDCSRYCWVYFLKFKSDTFQKFKEFQALVENHLDFKIRRLHTDGGGEYVSKVFKAYCRFHGIHQEFTQPHTPHQNGVAERKNRSLLNMSRSISASSHLPAYLWAEAVNTSNYLINITPTRANLGLTPHELLTGAKPDVTHLRIFGSSCQAHVSTGRKKLDPSSVSGVFVGYDAHTKGYRVYLPHKRRVIVTSDLKIHENTFFFSAPPVVPAVPTSCPDIVFFSAPPPKSPPDLPLPASPDSPRSPPVAASPYPPFPSPHLSSPLSVSPPTPCSVSPPAQVFSRGPRFNHHLELAAPVPPSALPTRDVSRSGRVLAPPARYHDFILNLTELHEPSTYAAAAVHPGWQAAMEREIHSIHQHGTWHLTMLPPGRTPITTKWIYRIKTHADGSPAKLKARLVARGFQQREGLDFDETYAPVAKYNTLRTLLAIAGHRGWTVRHLDVATAFLNGQLQEDVYVVQPQGFVDPTRPHHVCKLDKALYGLRQSPRCWYLNIDTRIQRLGLTKSTADPNLYYYHGESRVALLLLYVDDVYIFGDHPSKLTEMAQELMGAYDMTDMGTLGHSLGLEFHFTSSGVVVTQRGFAASILAEFGLSQCNPVATPMIQNLHLQVNMGEPPADIKMFQKKVGKLNFLTQTRADIAPAVSLVSRFNHAPQKPHMDAVNHILRYVRGTLDFGLCFKRGEDSVLTGYSDADWAGDRDDRKSTTGYVFMLGSTPITWRSQKQNCVACSSTEAEYVALSSAAREGMWLRGLLKELHILDDKTTTVLYCDNQSAIRLSENPVLHQRTKHIDIKHHYIRECVGGGHFKISHVPSADNVADIFTKPLGRTQFEHLRNHLGLVRTLDIAPHSG
jgi:transposase InsO family protein